MFTDDLTPFFSADEFAQAGTLAGAAVVGIFEASYAPGGVGIGMAGTQPVFTLPTSSVLGDPVGATLQTAGATFVVAAHEPDGTGISRLLLEAAA